MQFSPISGQKIYVQIPRGTSEDIDGDQTRQSRMSALRDGVAAAQR
jgi:hypothetical protein